MARVSCACGRSLEAPPVVEPPTPADGHANHVLAVSGSSSRRPDVLRLRRLITELEMLMAESSAPAPSAEPDPSGAPPPARRYRLGDLEIDTVARTVARREREVRLTRIQFELLVLLVQHRGRTVTGEEIVRHVWGADASGITGGSLRNLVSVLRRRLWPEGGGALWIRNAFGAGYRLVDDAAMAGPDDEAR